jgi:hypothetical protein
VIDVINTPGGMDQLVKLGVRKVPCVVVGDRYTFAQNLKDVATFLGISLERAVLPPERLIAKYLEILTAAHRMVRQIPADKMDERLIPNRPRTLRPFAVHIFRIAEMFLLTYEGAKFSEDMSQIQPPGDLRSTAEIAAYGENVRSRLASWWEKTADKTCGKSLQTYYGTQTALDLLERCTWHSAQHCRQLALVLDRYGIKPDGPPTPELLAGLPLPEGLWE